MYHDGYEIIIVRSKRRKKTIQAKLISESSIRIQCPYNSTDIDLEEFIKKDVIKFKFNENLKSGSVSLEQRANMLKNKFIPEAPGFTIEYSKTLRKTWGKCYFRDRKIVINKKMIDYPLWVTDMVIIHEIAHLIYPNHGKKFRKLISRYKLKERAKGFLIAKGYSFDKKITFN